jgi:hypothetical protein
MLLGGVRRRAPMLDRPQLVGSQVRQRRLLLHRLRRIQNRLLPQAGPEGREPRPLGLPLTV